MCDVPAKRVSEDKQRRAAFKAQILDARRKARFEKGRPQRDARMSTLLRLLDAVSYITCRPEHDPHFHECFSANRRDVEFVWAPKTKGRCYLTPDLKGALRRFLGGTFQKHRAAV